MLFENKIDEKIQQENQEGIPSCEAKKVILCPETIRCKGQTASHSSFYILVPSGTSPLYRHVTPWKAGQE